MNEISHQLIKFTPQQKAVWRKVAKQYGLTIGRGREKDWGSIQQLAEAIGDGRYLVVPNPTYIAENGEGMGK